MGKVFLGFLLLANTCPGTRVVYFPFPTTGCEEQALLVNGVRLPGVSYPGECRIINYRSGDVVEACCAIDGEVVLPYVCTPATEGDYSPAEVCR